MKDDAGQLDMEQFDCVSAGEPWRDYKLRASRILAGKVDDSASSLADAQIDADMGGVLGAPLPPAGNADGRSMARLRIKRNKVLFEWWTRHLASQTLQDTLSQPGGGTFQDGRATLAYLDGLFDRPARRSDLRAMVRPWDELNLTDDIGHVEDSITLFAVDGV